MCNLQLHQFKFFKTLLHGWLIFCMLFGGGGKYALINFRSPNQYTFFIVLLSIRISIRISKQSKHRDKQAKG